MIHPGAIGHVALVDAKNHLKVFHHPKMCQHFNTSEFAIKAVKGKVFGNFRCIYCLQMTKQVEVTWCLQIMSAAFYKMESGQL